MTVRTRLTKVISLFLSFFDFFNIRLLYILLCIIEAACINSNSADKGTDSEPPSPRRLSVHGGEVVSMCTDEG